jgi:hypothetical protein
MYYVTLYCQNAKLNRRGKFEVSPQNRSIPKWTILSSGNTTLELLRLITLSTADPRLLSNADLSLERFFKRKNTPLHLEFEIFHHPETEGRSSHQYLFVGSGLDFYQDGKNKRLSQRECNFLPPGGIYRMARHSQKPAKHFLLAYGCRFSAHDGTDDFDFTDPNHALTRFHSLFHTNRCLTDPVAFLQRLHFKGIKYKKCASLSILADVYMLLKKHLKIEPARFLDPQADLKRTWQAHALPQRKMILPLLDICRHLYDAFPKTENPLTMPGVIILHRPDSFCADPWFPAWIRLIDSLVPNMQFIISLSEGAQRVFPATVKNKPLRLQKPEFTAPSTAKQTPPRLPQKPILLIDVDGRLPNLALMKLSRYYKEKGKDVVLARKTVRMNRVDGIFASCIFNFESSMTTVRALKKYYGNDIQIGGSGVDLTSRLPENIEAMPADYDLYPELKDRAIGFLTRGCPHKCPFCVVPKKEGKTRKVSDLASLLGQKRKKLILLDDNLLAHAESEAMLEQMVSMGLPVNFTQTLDFRYINKRKAVLLRAIDSRNTRFTRPNYYFSLNNNKRLSLIANKYKWFDFKSRDNVEFICMYGFDTTLAQDVERFRFLRSLPGAYVFVQRYRPIRSDAPASEDIPFFDNHADRLIDELISIVFPQNMKSMEQYYRWLSRKYALTFGRLHDGLVDTIFRYNYRYKKGEYIATLAGTRKW